MMSYSLPSTIGLQERALLAAFACRYRLFGRAIRPERAFSFRCSSEAINNKQDERAQLAALRSE
jgi:hypothetical protein